jgi:hypothetical protein
MSHYYEKFFSYHIYNLNNQCLISMYNSNISPILLSVNLIIIYLFKCRVVHAPEPVKSINCVGRSNSLVQPFIPFTSKFRTF